MRAITGSITFSSSTPSPPPRVTAASFPITCAATWIVTSRITGLTFPGMMEEPGCSDGREISPIPHRGPDDRSRRSWAIFIRDAATPFSAPLAATSGSCAPIASNRFSAGRNGIPVARAISAIVRAANSGWAFNPVPTAVPPSGSSSRSANVARTRRIPWSTWEAYPENSCPSVTGTASCKWVLPIFRTSENSAAFPERASRSAASAGRSRSDSSRRAAIRIADGITSLLDWHRFAWSFGWTGAFPPSGFPSSSFARFASTSFTFMFVEVPEPVWKTSTTNWSSNVPSRTSRAAREIASARGAGRTPSPALTSAASPFTSATAWTTGIGIPCPLTGKFSTARCDCAP